MEELKLSTALGNALGTGTAVAVVLLILWKVLARIVERWIATLDGVSKAVADHTRVDLEHHAEVREAVVRVEAKVDSALDWQRRTPSQGFTRVPPDDDSEPESRRATTATDRDRTPSERRRAQAARNRTPPYGSGG